MRKALLAGLPCLGICLGMQLLMDESEEGKGKGLGVLAGSVTRLRTKRVPQIGWNEITACADPAFDSAPVSIAYFANSFVCHPVDESRVIAWSTHENDRFPAAVRRGNVRGEKIHPAQCSAARGKLVRPIRGSERAVYHSVRC